MKKFITIILVLIANLNYGQGYKTSLELSPGGYSYTGKNIIASIPFIIGAKEEYYFSKHFALGLGLEYNIYNETLPEPLFYGDEITPSISFSSPNYIINTLNIPLIIKGIFDNEYNKGLYFFTGGGISVMLPSFMIINSNESTYPPKKADYEVRTVTIKNGSGNIIGTFWTAGMGKSFRIKKQKFFCEIKLRGDINQWYYQYYYIPGSRYQITLGSLSLKLGYMF